MANNQRNNDSIIGYITNVSNENKKKKYFIKFTLVTTENQIVDGWVFSTKTGILSTPLGEALTKSLNEKKGIKLYGTMEQQQNFSMFKMQSFSQFQEVNLNRPVDVQTNQIVSIEQALSSNDSLSVRCFIIQINPSTEYNEDGLKRTSSFVVIADESSTAYLLINDLKPDTLQINKVYEISKIRKKNINNSTILSTTIDSNIISLNITINPNVNNLNHTMSIDLTEMKTIEASITEVGEIRHSSGCSVCSGQLKEHLTTSMLLCCEKCKRYSLKQNKNEKKDTSIVLNIENEKIILYVNDGILRKIMNILGISPDATDTELIIGLISNGHLNFTYNQINRHLIDVKPLE